MKIIPIPLSFGLTDTIYETKMGFKTADVNSAVLQFTSDSDPVGCVATLSMKNETDNSNRFSLVLEQMNVTENPFSYTLGDEIGSSGVWIGEITLKKDLVTVCSQEFRFAIGESLQTSIMDVLIKAKSVDEMMVAIQEDVTEHLGKSEASVKQITAYVNGVVAKLLATDNTRTLQERDRVLAELTRETDYQSWVLAVQTLIDTAVIDNRVQAIIAEYQSTYAQSLFSLGSQLADIAINVKSFGAVGDGVTDDTVAIQNAHTSTLNGYVYLPPGNYKITSPIIYKKPMRGANKNKTSLYSYISDGSPVVLIDNIDYWELSDFVIRGQQKNCFGITAINDSSWYSMKNVDVLRCGLGGFDVEGWGGIIEDCHAVENSGNGWTLRNANGVKANLHSDSNGGTGIVIESGGGLHLLSILSEGNKQGGLLINEAENIVLTCPYFEGNKKYQLKAGFGLNEIGDLVIVGGKSTNTDKTNEGNFLFDKVNGLTVSKTLLNCQSNNPIETTANTKNVTMDLERPRYGFVHDSGISLNRSFNYMPNPFFDVWLSGYERISHSSSVMSISKETTINKHGKQSLKVQSLPNTYGFIALGLPDKTLESLKGKKIGFGAWIYVPNISEFDIIERQPLIQIFNGTARIGFNQSYLKKGRWNFVTSHTPLSIHEAVTSLVVEIYPHVNTDSTATGNEFIIVDSIFVSEYDSANYSSLMMGNLPDHNSLPTINNGNITNYGTAAPVNNAAMGKYVFNVGDRVINSVPVVGQPKSWVCTVASNGNVGTWVSEGIL